jgi:hypothetical protein
MGWMSVKQRIEKLVVDWHMHTCYCHPCSEWDSGASPGDAPCRAGSEIISNMKRVLCRIDGVCYKDSLVHTGALRRTG